MTNIAINIGVWQTAESAFPGWSPQLPPALCDVRALTGLLGHQGFEIRDPLLNADATAAKVKAAIRDVRRDLAAGGNLILSFSGHGGYIPSANGSWDPRNSMKALVVYDRFLLSGELFDLFSTFPDGSSIVFVVDGCFVGKLFRVTARASYVPISEATWPGGEANYTTVRLSPGTLRADGGFLAPIGPISVPMGVSNGNTTDLTNSDPAVLALLNEITNKDLTVVGNRALDQALMEREYSRLKSTYDRLRDATEWALRTQPPIPVLSLLSSAGDQSSGDLACVIGATGLPTCGGGVDSPCMGVFTYALQCVHQLQPRLSYREYMLNVAKFAAWIYLAKNPTLPLQIPQSVVRGPQRQSDDLINSIAFLGT